MVRAWKMHFLPAVELLARFPCVDCTESPQQARTSFSGSCCSQTYGHPQHVQSNLESFTGTVNSGAQHKGLIFPLWTAGIICSWSAWEKVSCAGGWATNHFFLITVWERTFLLPALLCNWVFLQLCDFISLSVLRLHLSRILHWITVWNGSAVSTLRCHSRRVPQRSLNCY